MSKQTPTLEQHLAKIASRILGDFYVSMPAIVESYDKERQCVDATPCLLVAVEREDGEMVYERLPTTMRAPVWWTGAGGAGVTFPIKRGDLVSLVYPSASLGRWLAVGGVAESQDHRRHDLGSAIAIPGGHSFGGSTSPKMTPATDGPTLHAGPGQKLHLSSPDADDPVIRKSDLDAVVSKMNALISTYNTHVHADPASGSTGGPSATQTTITAPSGSPKVFTD